MFGCTHQGQGEWWCRQRFWKVGKKKLYEKAGPGEGRNQVEFEGDSRGILWKARLVAQEPSNRTTFAGCHVYRSFHYINNAGPRRQHKKQRYEWLLHFSSLNSPQFQAAISNHLADCFSGCTRIEDQRRGHGAPAKVALASTRRNENEEFTAPNYIRMLTANMCHGRIQSRTLTTDLSWSRKRANHT